MARPPTRPERYTTYPSRWHVANGPDMVYTSPPSPLRVVQGCLDGPAQNYTPRYGLVARDRRAQLLAMEHEMVTQVKDSMEEVKNIHKEHRKEIEALEQQLVDRLSQNRRHSKKQQAKLHQRVLCLEKEKADALHHVKVLQDQVILSASEVRQARHHIFELNSEAQTLRTRAPRVVVRAEPGATGAIEVE
ncbi:unnamed protein product, partial [Choristocarpus tenellus]